MFGSVDEYTDYCKEAGYNYIGNNSNHVYFFYSLDPNAIPISTDYEDKLFKITKASSGIFILSIIWAITFLFRGSNDLYLFYLALFSAVFLKEFDFLIWYFEQKKSISKGHKISSIPLESFKLKQLFNKISLTLILIMLIITLTPFPLTKTINNYLLFIFPLILIFCLLIFRKKLKNIHSIHYVLSITIIFSFLFNHLLNVFLAIGGIL